MASHKTTYIRTALYAWRGILALYGKAWCNGCGTTADLQRMHNDTQCHACRREKRKQNPRERELAAIAEQTPERKATRARWRATKARKESSRRYYTQEHVLEKIREYRKAHPLQVGARGAISHAVRYGRLVKQPCIQCGNPKVEAHHHLGYEQEHWLDIQWLCKKCHTAVHARESA